MPTVLITGASRGIGRSIATRLASDGHHVVLVARSAGPLEELAAEIKAAGGSACAVPCDLSDGEAVTAMVEGVASDHGRLDVLVNNAGIKLIKVSAWRCCLTVVAVSPAL